MPVGNRDNTRLVYSTEGGRVEPESHPRARERTGDGTVRVSRTKAGRKGKTVTLVSGLPATHVQSLAKELKRACGVGGSVKEGTVELQGDQRDAVVAALSDRFKVVRAGG